MKITAQHNGKTYTWQAPQSVQEITWRRFQPILEAAKAHAANPDDFNARLKWIAALMEWPLAVVRKMELADLDKVEELASPVIMAALHYQPTDLEGFTFKGLYYRYKVGVTKDAMLRGSTAGDFADAMNIQERFEGEDVVKALPTIIALYAKPTKDDGHEDALQRGEAFMDLPFDVVMDFDFFLRQRVKRYTTNLLYFSGRLAKKEISQIDS
jgi:hypothetical protein